MAKENETSGSVLVVGGAGYIGSHVVLALLENKESVIVADNMSSGKVENLHEGVPFIHCDVQIPYSLERVFKEYQPSAVIHLAARKAAGESMLDPERYSQENLIGSLNLLHACIKNKVKHFVFSSSAAVYGSPQYLPIDEKHPTDPDNYYGFTKLEMEGYLKWYSKLKGLKFAALRYFNAAGYDPKGRVKGLESNPANLLPVIMEAAAGIREKLTVFGDDYDTEDGTGVRDYVHVTDLADAHAKSLVYLREDHKENAGNLLVNLGSETGISVKEMLDVSIEVSGQDISYEIGPRRAGDPAKLVATSSTAKKLLGWEAKHSDAKSLIETTWNSYKKLLK